MLISVMYGNIKYDIMQLHACHPHAQGTPLMTLLQALAVLAVHSLSCFQQAQQAIRSGMFSVSSDGEQLGSASQQLEQQCSSQPERGHQDRHSQDDSMIHWSECDWSGGRCDDCSDRKAYGLCPVSARAPFHALCICVDAHTTASCDGQTS